MDVILCGGDRRRPGIRIHRLPGLRPDEITKCDRIPVTTPARTLLDLATVAPWREIERVLVEALGKGQTNHAEIERLLRRHAGHRGTAKMRALLASGEPSVTRSEAEKRFRALIGRSELPAPEANARLAGYEVDFLWRTQRLVVEVDGFAYHSTRGRFASDRRRDLALSAAGYRVVRITWNQLVDGSEALLVQLTRALYVR